MEIRAVVPALHEDFSSEPLYVRDRIGSHLDWTGATPPPGIAERMESELPPGMKLAALMERGMTRW